MKPNTYMLWQFDFPKEQISKNILDAKKYYINKHGEIPNLCYMNPKELENEYIEDGITVKTMKEVQLNHLLMGVSGNNK